jgi:hypothetical protein
LSQHREPTGSRLVAIGLLKHENNHADEWKQYSRSLRLE